MLHRMAMSLTEDRRPARQQLASADVLGGRYLLLNQVGRGGMSVVWRARDNVSERLVAVKVLAEAAAEDPGLRRRLRQEARITAAVSSPNVVQVSDCGQYQCGDGTAPFIVMELVDGITLHDRLNAGPVPAAAAMRIGAQVASALAAIHAAGVVHCDIKPANIMLVGDAVKVVDFGIAAHAGSEDPLNHPFQVIGTPAYMAPERLTGHAVRAPADVYALGILLYRLLAGRSPWPVESTMQMLTAHVSQHPAPMPPRAEIPAFVTALGSQCLAKNPASRPSASEAEAVLARGALMSTEAGMQSEALLGGLGVRRCVRLGAHLGPGRRGSVGPADLAAAGHTVTLWRGGLDV
jgi:serine/threonine protein kinase